ncbi:MAG: hypothetical protein AM324_004040 [Candidatus Thorarchaeota archaeon SMTZ1-83]|nr:MAG: hypothetical protein AM324_05150 [Candidatus Thorarchaeota archaeon SMTZ1-83]
MTYLGKGFVTLFLTSQICGVVVAQDSMNVRMLGEVHHFVNQCYDVAMSGDYAYISSGLASGLRVIDISDPSTPVEVGYSINSDPCPEVPMWMADRVIVSGDYAYVLYFDGTWSFRHYRLYAYDVSNPFAPQQMGNISLPDNCTSQFAEGLHVYVSAFDFDGFSGIKVIDVSDPMTLVEVGSFETPGYPQSVYVADTIAYVADNNALVVYDVTDPGSPVELGSYSPTGEMALIQHVVVQGDYVYIIDANFGVRVLGASNFSEIEEVGVLPHNQTDAHFSRMKLFNDLLYYLQDGDISDKKLIILDVTDPTAPLEVGSHEMPGFWWFYGFDCSDEYACIAAGQEGLRVADISVPDSIVDVSTYDFYDLTSGLAVSGDYAFVGTYMRYLVIYDVSDPSSPTEVASLDFPDSPIKQISVWGDHLYVPGVALDHKCGVSVLDISDPTAPEEIAYWPAFEGYSGAPFNVERYEEYAVLACALGGVEIYDVTDIDQPVPLGNWTLWDPFTNPDFGVTNVKISWPYVFAPDRALGLYVLDVSDPTRITAVAACETPGDAMWADITRDHNHVYVADFDGGLRVIDVSDPLAPVEVGFHEGELERATHVAAYGDSVYVSDGGEMGLHVFDVSDPTTPSEVAYHKTPGVYGHDVAVSGGLVYFLDFTHLEIFEITEVPSVAEDIQPASLISDYGVQKLCPNPCNTAAKIIFDVREAGHVVLEVYNINGQKVQTLLDAPCTAGRHTHVFQATDVPAGTYFLRLVTWSIGGKGGHAATKKLSVIR